MRESRRGSVALFEVSSHVTRLAEFEAAFAARVGLHSRVIVHVSLEMMFLCKGLGTEITRIRFDTGM